MTPKRISDSTERTEADRHLRLAIMIPAYNAAGTIEAVFDRIPLEVHRQTTNIIVVDDGSTDDTTHVLERLQLRYSNVVILKHPQNRGYGATEKTLLDRAMATSADVFVLLHSDGQYPPEALPRLLEPLQEKRADLVQGSRMMSGHSALSGGMPVYKYAANRALTWLANRVLGMQLAEYHSGMLLYSRKAIEEIPFRKLVDTFCFDQTMLIMSKVKGLRVAQVPIPTCYADEVSHLKPIEYGLQTLGVLYAYCRGHYSAL